jgi:prevent-host-death family protein
MGTAWQLQEAKNKFSEVVERAINRGPQEITRHGRKAAIVLSIKEYQKLRNRKGSLAEFFRNSPLGAISIERSRDIPRRIEL